MKKLILLAVAVFAFTFANAQEETTTYGFGEGDVFISGTVGFNSTKQGDFKSNGFTLAPKAGYFFTENIAIGLGLGYTSAKEEVGPLENKVNTLGFDVFGRYYFTPASQFSLFGELNLGYDTTDNDDFKVNTFGVDLGLGMNYWVSSNFALEAGLGVLGYSSAKADTNGAEATNTFQLLGDMQNISLGVLYRF